jgi:hypothetical protein
MFCEGIIEIVGLKAHATPVVVLEARFLALFTRRLINARRAIALGRLIPSGKVDEDQYLS